MTKANLTADVAKKTGMSCIDTKIVIESLLDTITKHLCSHHTISIRGFGTWSVLKGKARPARNPKTGDVVILPEHYRVKFKTAGKLRALARNTI
jgi:nucleoid DNA-binding protein